MLVAGLVQGLRELDLLNMGLSAQALGALGVSLSLSCPTPSLEVLRLSDISLPNQVGRPVRGNRGGGTTRGWPT